MSCSSLVFIVITLALSSHGSFVRASDSRDSLDPIEKIESSGRSNASVDSLSGEVILHQDSSNVEGSGHIVDKKISQALIHHIPKESERPSNENHSRIIAELILPHSGRHDQGADKANTSVTGHTSVILEDALYGGSHITTEEHFKESHASTEYDDFQTGVDSSQFPVQTHVFTSMTDQNLPESDHPCGLHLSPCVVHTNFNGTNLLWDDMRRTLAFAWELHVFGSSSLFILMTVLAVLGMACALTLPHPLRDALTLTNGLLILSGILRAALLLLDPYGTRQILSHASLAAMHNIPVELLLWAQVPLTLVTLHGLELQHLRVVGGLAISHCILLLVADLYSPAVMHVLPLLLYTLSLCLGLPFCMGTLIKSLSHQNSSLRSSCPQWGPSYRIERRAKRIMAVCALLGVLCCTLQVYSLLWLNGLMGNWRRFGWGWWLSQFWARILELAWGFSLLVVGSWIFWKPLRGNSKGDHEQTRWWDRVLARLKMRSLRKSEKKWEGLIPNNWAKYNLSRTGISKNRMCPYDDHTSTTVPQPMPDPVSNTSSDSQAALLWQKVGERECILSLIEFDMRPPSPINLRLSIDNALHHGQLVAGNLFTPPPPSWTHTVGQGNGNGENDTTFPPAYVGYGWMLDTESIPTCLDYFQAKEPMHSPNATTVYSDHNESPIIECQNEELNLMLSAVLQRHDWSEDDVTDL